MAFRMIDIIEKKKRGASLTDGEIGFFIAEYTRGGVPDYQAAALLMAVCLRDMDESETAALTEAMAGSGRRADLSALPGIKVDKHSTGGVADTTTLIAAPLVAACGVPVAKMSGRGLGHTGGTLDKLLSIPGMRVEFTVEEMIGLVRRAGLAVVGQSDELNPADRKLYALRDATATVNHTALIASSIMSKKIAAGCQGLALDVKAGSGAFMGEAEEARRLARVMTALGRRAGLRAAALVTDMNQPLGRRVGNGLEVREALEVLSGGLRRGRLRQVALALAAQMLTLGGAAADPAQAERMLLRALDDGRGMERLLAMVAAQGGDAAALARPESLWPVRAETEIPAPRSGFVVRMDARAIGRAACLLGAGRLRREDAVDPAAGVTMDCELGDRVSAGQRLAVFHVNAGDNLEEARRVFTDAVVIGDEPPAPSPLILERIAP